jgi:hypothetical protein
MYFCFSDFCNVMPDEWYVEPKHVAMDDKYKRFTLFVPCIVIQLLHLITKY